MRAVDRSVVEEPAEVMSLFGAAGADLDPHDGVAAELYWAS